MHHMFLFGRAVTSRIAFCGYDTLSPRKSPASPPLTQPGTAEAPSLQWPAGGAPAAAIFF